MKIKLIAFDLDDTLYPEREFVRSGFAAVADYLDSLGIVKGDKFVKTAWKLFVEGVRGTIFNQALDLLECNFPPERIPELISAYQLHRPDIKAFPDSSRLLTALLERGVITALISDGPESTQENKFTALGLVDFFEHIIFTGSYGPEWAKPSIYSFLEVMQRGKVAAENCVYVADNPQKDFLGPNRLGWRTIRVREKEGIYYDETPPRGGEPMETVECFANLFDFLLEA